MDMKNPLNPMAIQWAKVGDYEPSQLPESQKTHDQFTGIRDGVEQIYLTGGREVVGASPPPPCPALPTIESGHMSPTGRWA